MHHFFLGGRLMNSNSVARIAIASLALVFGLAGPAFGQEPKKPSPSSVAKPNKATKPEHSKNSSAQRDFEEAHKFIEKINSISEPQPRGEFETREAYEARQPSLSLDKSVLLRLERGFKDYSYDIDRKLLSIHIPVAKIEPRKRKLTGLPIQAAYKIESQGEYIASNAYGAKVKVEKTYSTNYVMYVPDSQLDGLVTEKENPALASLPESMRASMRKALKDEKTIVVTLAAEPDNAKRISENFAVLFRVRPKGLENSVFEATLITKPTISEPKESTLFTRAIEVDLLEILVRDGASGSILLKKTIGQFSAPSASESGPTDATESTSAR
jgi:hypothetical protein